MHNRGAGTLLLAALFLAVGIAGGLGVAFFTGSLPGIGEEEVSVQEVRKLNELSSVRWRESVPVTEESGGFGLGPELFDNLRGESVVLIAVGEVRAGVDLGRLGQGDVGAEDGRVTIDLPEPEILSAALDEDETRVYDRDQGLLDFSADEELETEARREAVRRLEGSARDNGILDQAEDNAEASLRAFVLSLGFEEVRFE
ncbi:DUF4230 domain-containing protein [Rubrobacter aplysinae]|uniref:DUF4230 domain-containing protein n=1 Tax=Rubrobacter aplysinae TaxID=909625 RepID=UPI00064BCB86|nr:DUF4230 domain-containing protein [Rubrobacter aplysinae]